jgi:hypothetical protein
MGDPECVPVCVTCFQAAAGGPIRVTMGRLTRGSVNLRCAKGLLERGLLEGRIPLDRRQTELFATTAGTLALVAYQTARGMRAMAGDK